MKGKKITITFIAIATLFAFVPALKSCNTTHQDNNPYEITALPKLKNLQIFLIDPLEETLKTKYITLEQAMEKKYVVVKETSQVSELSIKNNSDHYIYINSGDIVKGGKQDRTVQYDMIIPPHSKQIPLPSFCVEAGRWNQRKNEDVERFASNTKMISSAALKLAVKYENQQSSVWSNVAKQQVKMNDNLSDIMGEAVDVKDKQSASSLQLTLENEELQKLIEEYKKVYEGLLSDHKNAVGFAYAINGEIYGADIYNNRQLFEDLWDKHLDAIIAEAISENNDENSNSEARERDVIKILSKQYYLVQTEIINSATTFKTFNKDEYYFFESIDKEKNAWIHKSYLTKIH